MLHIFRALHVAYAPAEYSAERRRQTLRILKIINGLVYILAIATVGFLGWGLMGPLTQGAGPDRVIPLADFAENDLSGTLSEARVGGVLRTQDLRNALIPSALLRFDRPVPFVPLTGPDWKTGDPVQVFVVNNWLLPDQTDAASVAAAFEKTGVSLDPTHPAPLDLSVARYTLFDFDGAPDDLLARAGFSVTPPVILLQIAQTDRPRLLQTVYGRYISLAKILGVLAFIFGIAFIPAARNLQRFKPAL